MIVVSVCSLKGGVGKTSVVLGLASAALAKGIPALVVDLDPQADATLGLDVASDITSDIATVLGASRRNAVQTTVVPSGWAPEGGKVDVLPGSQDIAALDRPTGGERTLARLSGALATLTDYRVVLVDCPPSLGTITRSGLGASNRAIVVTEPALFSVTAADRALHVIDDVRRTSAPGLQPLGVLVNRYRVQELGEMFGPLVLGPSIRERSALQQAQGASQPIHRWPGAPAQELASAFDAHLARILRANTRSSPRPRKTAATASS